MRSIGGLVAASVALSLLAGATASGAPLPASPAVLAPTPSVEDESSSTSSQADLDAQKALLDELTAAANRTGDELARAEAQLRAASLAASAALESYATASQAALAADLAEDAARDALLRARLDADRARRDLGEWARSSYRNGPAGPATEAALLAMLQGAPTDDVAAAVQLARAVGQSQTAQVHRLARVEQAQVEAAQRAREAAAAASSAATSAELARRERDAAVRARAALVTDLRVRLARTRSDTELARRRIADLTAELSVATTTSVGSVDASCPGGSLAGYANGRLPTSALCPLWSAPGHLLRADAAAAFNRLSRAYAQVFGRAICVTDSYRTYPEQVTLYATKPSLAAVPGTSNHGWGTATDLCGGVQSFGTAQHDWLAAHAPAFGWFHPAWARRGGSRPEPWHFEFGG